MKTRLFFFAFFFTFP
ncbi:hypothetical protein [Rahnella sp. PAMC 25559]